MEEKSLDDLIMEYNVRFTNGEQYLILRKDTCEIIEEPKKYYWEERQVYNHIINYVDLLNSKYKLRFNNNEECFSECIFGKNGFVSKLIPYQRDYNNLKNKEKEYIEKAVNSILLVEDGSVDTDNLDSDGLAPGKILIYRNGATPPKDLFNFNKDIMDTLEKQEKCILKEMENLYYKERDILDNILLEMKGV